MSQKSYDEGYEANKSGRVKSSLDTPYPDGSQDAKDWTRGWRSFIPSSGSSSSGINRLDGKGRNAVRGSGFQNGPVVLDLKPAELDSDREYTKDGSGWLRDGGMYAKLCRDGKIRLFDSKQAAQTHSQYGNSSDTPETPAYQNGRTKALNNIQNLKGLKA